MSALRKTFVSTLILGLLTLCLSVFNSGCTHNTDWRKTDRSSVGLAPPLEETEEAVVQLYAARAFNWRQYVAVHSWISLKEKGAKQWTTFQVVGWRVRNGQSAIVESHGLPDKKWYGNEPKLLMDLRGEDAEKAIPKIISSVKDYPYPNTYRAYPGPNSNTFISYIIRNVDELTVELPPHAIGKDWLVDSYLFSKTESGTGVQMSVLGLLGFSVGAAEGFELNLLGMNFGFDFMRPAIKLPFLGRVGMKDENL
ncbi:MAG: DUF3750 domain-containing protein [Bdellovibrionota bacterium]|nr:DUF3750 domain-containing protein [Bdellovibrionota bacterium]